MPAGALSVGDSSPIVMGYANPEEVRRDLIACMLYQMKLKGPTVR